MRRLEYEYNMHIDFSKPVHDHQYLLRALISDNMYQKVVSQDYEISPSSYVNMNRDSFDNSVLYGYLKEEHNSFDVKVKGLVEVEYQHMFLEEAHPMYKVETKLTEYDEVMNKLLSESDSFMECMMEICRNIYYELYYTPESTNVNTTAKEAFELKKGVCQDFANIMISVVRKLGYPARYVTGMMVGEGASHAWVEVYNDGKWYGFDPTNNRVINNQYIVIAKGRDYRDCAMEKGIFEADELVDQKLTAHVKVTVV